MSSGSAQPRPAAPGAAGASVASRKAFSGAGGREVFRLAPPLILWWVWVAFAAANFADFAIQGTPSARFTIVLTAILATVTGLCYVLALRPKVIASETGITVVNPFRVHQIPWGTVRAVETGDWVRVRCAPAPAPAPAPAVAAPGTGTAGGHGRGSASARTVYCWALYVSARAKRRSGRVAASPRRQGPFRSPAWLSEGPGHGGQSRLPEEARYLASLPVSKAIAARLNTRAQKERNRAAANASAATSAVGGAGVADGAGVATTTWYWPALAIVVVPALLLLAAVAA